MAIWHDLAIFGTICGEIAHVVPSDQVYSLLATWHRVYRQFLGLTSEWLKRKGDGRDGGISYIERASFSHILHPTVEPSSGD